MRKIAILVLALIVFLSLLRTQVLAADSCSLIGEPSGFDIELDNRSPSHTVSFNLGNYANDSYTLIAGKASGPLFNTALDARTPKFTLGQNGTYSNNDGTLTVQDTTVTWKITDEATLYNAGLFGDKVVYVKLFDDGGLVSWGYKCTIGSFTVTEESTGEVATSCELKVWQERGGEECGGETCMENGGIKTYYEATNMKTSDGSLWGGWVTAVLGGPGGIYPDQTKQATNGAVSGEFEAEGGGEDNISVATGA